MHLPIVFARPLYAARRWLGRWRLRARSLQFRLFGPRWQTRLLGGSWRTLKWSAIGLAGFAVLFTGHRLIGPSLIWPKYQAQHERAMGTALYDSRGRFLGIMPGQLDPAGDYDVDEDHKTLRLDRVPDGWWRTLVALEDENLDTWRSWGGIDFIAMIAGFSRYGLSAVGLGSRRGRGGSSLAMQLVRSINHIDPSRSKTFARKIFELKDAPILYDQLGRTRFKRWLAMHVPLVTGTLRSRMGQPIYGLRAASLVLYGVEPAKLSRAKQAMFAAAFKRPILIASDRDHIGLRARDIIWWRLKQRAALGLLKESGSRAALVLRLMAAFARASRTPGKHVPAAAIAPLITAQEAAGLEPLIGPARVLALKELGGLAAPAPRIDPALEPLLPAEANRRFRVLANPTARALYFARPVLSQTIAELQDSYGRTWRLKVDRVHLTVDMVRNAAFVAAVRLRLARYQRNIGAGISLPLVGKAEERAQVVVAVADANARLVLFFQNAEDRIYGGDQWKRDRDGRYDPGRETRHIASLGKVLVALHLAQSDTPKKRYCNVEYKRPSLGTFVRNASAPRRGYANCRVAAARVTAREVFARSLNLPLIHRLSYRDERRLRRLVKTFGFRRVADATLKEALPLGIVSGAPRTSHRMMHAVALGITGNRGRASAPRIIDSVRTWDNAKGFSRRAVVNAREIAGYRAWFAEPAARTYLRTVLSAPVIHRRGTFRALRDISKECNAGVDLHLAKTGTSTTGTGEVRDKFAAGAVRIHGRLYSYFAMIGSGNPHHRTLGNDIRHPHLAGLLRIGMNRLGHGRLERCGRPRAAREAPDSGKRKRRLKRRGR